MDTELSTCGRKDDEVMDMEKGSRSDQKCNGMPLPPGKGVVIEHNGCKCLAYLDAAGNWRDYYDGDVLNGEVKYQPG